MTDYEKMANSFEVEELEERVEFSSWATPDEVKLECDTSGECTGTITWEF